MLPTKDPVHLVDPVDLADTVSDFHPRTPDPTDFVEVDLVSDCNCNAEDPVDPEDPPQIQWI